VPLQNLDMVTPMLSMVVFGGRVYGMQLNHDGGALTT
jgi:hypothetical protein